MIGYEWVIEEVDEHGDIQSVNHADTFHKAIQVAAATQVPEGWHVDVGLVRDRWTEEDGVEDRQWAYLEDGKLPQEFDGGAMVPVKFLKQTRAFNCHSTEEELAAVLRIGKVS